MIFLGCLRISWTDPPVCICAECPPWVDTPVDSGQVVGFISCRGGDFRLLLCSSRKFFFHKRVMLRQSGVVMYSIVLRIKAVFKSNNAKQFCPGGHSAHMHTGGSVQEILRQPKNITSASMQPKNISSFYIYKPVHEHKISPNNANRSQDCLHRTQKYQYNDVWYQKISST